MNKDKPHDLRDDTYAPHTTIAVVEKQPLSSKPTTIEPEKASQKPAPVGMGEPVQLTDATKR